MSLKFNEALKILLEGLPKPSNPESKLYTQDAIEISVKINQELINMNSIFKGTVSGWLDTCTYLLKDIYKIWIPHICINMPFKIEPRLVGGHPLRVYRLKTSAYHPVVENGYVNFLKLTKLFYWDISQAIQKLGKINCKSGRTYNSLHTEFIEPDRFQIVIKEYEEQQAPSILYNFSISFTFSQESPSYLFFHDHFQQTEKSIIIELPTKISEMVNKINVLLLQLDLDSSLTVDDMHCIVGHVILKLQEDKLEEILLEVMTKFIPLLKNFGPLVFACAKLWKFKQAGSVKMSELKAVFGME
nr:uncharacterized protein LOC108085796 [Drosophila kikkawai]